MYWGIELHSLFSIEFDIIRILIKILRTYDWVLIILKLIQVMSYSLTKSLAINKEVFLQNCQKQSESLRNLIFFIKNCFEFVEKVKQKLIFVYLPSFLLNIYFLSNQQIFI